ncbi:MULTISPECIES: YgcG family protein [Vagococcus]|uniref:Beta-propeller domains of methanol dehydrogenase type n=1 Tax=Vagococcus fluvialis bH819 TaxID=1255619 RepID=A0A1X6WK71_9ENTE|nr:MULTISPECIES: TPM domain-containing protein [Vagococcus]SLM84733.1 Beta-propeller domains of methanol dehydrogenase type [Vagococcus fluvialis bH819]HCM89805.1 TPM domain-containing protein [Vagococcus sp.]
MERICYKKQSKMGLIIGLLVVVMSFIIFSGKVFADSDNIFVEDNANILTTEDKNYIKQINEEVFITLPGEPQYAVVTLKSLKGFDSIESYAEKKFKELGIGNKELNNGFLFVIAVEDREYRLETGYGVEEIITDSMKEDIVTSEATDLLQDEKYGASVMMISKNIEQLVKLKYSDLDSAKEMVVAEKERQEKIVKMIFIVVLFFFILAALVAIIYILSIMFIRKKLTKSYLAKELVGYIYIDKTNAILGATKGASKVNLSEAIAKKINRMPNKMKFLSNESDLKNYVAQFLLIDSLIQYCKQFKKEAPYNVSVYLDSKHLDTLKSELIPISSSFDYPVTVNPYLSDVEMLIVGDYVEIVTEKHRQSLKIAAKNKKFIETVSQQYASEKEKQLGRIDYKLIIALMVYYFLKDKDLSDPELLGQLTINEASLEKAYKFAKKRKKEIDSDQRQKALNDLTNMSLGNYYMHTMIWSSYNESSGGSSGGGSTFGGGSSGGGGFSGGW